jgi:two-component system sensor histidine kinase GlrK
VRVASKVATGSGITIVLLVAVLIYDLLKDERLNQINREFAEIGLTATTISLEQSRLLFQISEFTRKQFVTSDVAYTEGLNDLHLEFWQHLERLRSQQLSENSRAKVEELTRLWRLYLSDFSVVVVAPDGTSDTVDGRQDRLLGLIDRLQRRVKEVGRTAQADLTQQAEKASAANARAHQLYWLAAVLVALVSVLILWLTVRAINTPLTKLAEGTQAVSQGEFSYRLDSSGHDEFSKLAGSFNDMVERLGDAERVKKDFLTHVSHELKSPLASMEETTELLLEEIPGPLTSRQRRFLGLNLDSGRRLSAMISRILDLSRLEAGVMEYEFRVHSLGAMVSNVADEFEARARERGIRIHYVPPPQDIRVECDRDRIYQVLQNLLDNAMKVSPAGEVIELRADARNEFAEVEIADRGPGIEDSHKERIFEKFHQQSVRERSRSGRGVGLGLAICREIMAAHRGEVWVRDHSGGGSVFGIHIPVSVTAKDHSSVVADDSYYERVELDNVSG